MYSYNKLCINIMFLHNKVKSLRAAVRYGNDSSTTCHAEHITTVRAFNEDISKAKKN